MKTAPNNHQPMMSIQDINCRYTTDRAFFDIPHVLKMELWALIDGFLADKKAEEVDYLQIFELSDDNGKQKIVHSQEVPCYKHTVWLPSDKPIDAKILVFDFGEHTTMMFEDEY